MKIQTTRFGEIEIKEEEIIQLTQPLLGFPDYHRYIIRDHSEDSPFKWFQSVDEGALAFVILDPQLFKPDYQVYLTNNDTEELELSNADDAAVYCLVVIPNDPKKMTANLQAPLVFNRPKKLAKQVVLNNPDLPIKYPVFGG